MQSCEGYRSPSEFDLRELDRFRRLTKHREIATARAMDYCVKYQIYPPEWLVVEAASLLIELLKREKPTKRGRTASCLARLQHEMWDVERWDAVKTVRELREKCRREEAALKACRGAAAINARKQRL